MHSSRYQSPNTQIGTPKTIIILKKNQIKAADQVSERGKNQGNESKAVCQAEVKYRHT